MTVDSQRCWLTVVRCSLKLNQPSYRSHLALVNRHRVKMIKWRPRVKPVVKAPRTTPNEQRTTTRSITDSSEGQTYKDAAPCPTNNPSLPVIRQLSSVNCPSVISPPIAHFFISSICVTPPLIANFIASVALIFVIGFTLLAGKR